MSSSQTTVTGFHHVAIRARDFDRSVRFYTEVIGLTPKVVWGQAPQRAIMLGAGDAVYLEVFERPEQPTASEGEAVILHFALRTHDTIGMLERARAAGCPVTMEPRRVDIANTAAGMPDKVPVHIAFVTGPDGESIEFFENDLT